MSEIFGKNSLFIKNRVTGEKIIYNTKNVDLNLYLFISKLKKTDKVSVRIFIYIWLSKICIHKQKLDIRDLLLIVVHKNEPSKK